MNKRSVGDHTGFEVGAVGLGCMGLTWAYGETDDSESARTLLEAVSLGVDFFDTAEVYGPHTNEELLARHLKPAYGRVKVATKFGFAIEAGTGAPGAVRGVDSRPENVRKACEGSLRRLQIDTIDLFYQHRVDPAVPIEDTVGAMADLVKEGKVQALGLSEASSTTLRRAHAVHPIAALQSEYSLWERGVEADILPTCRALGIGFVAYSPLGRGFLAGKTTVADKSDFRAQLPRFSAENAAKNQSFLLAIDNVASKHGVSRAQVALAWVLAQGVVVIPGAKKVAHLRDNVAAGSLALEAEDVRFLSEACPVGKAAGARYGEGAARWIDRAT
jgi:aryl-alcohol dehydrogenase-like predicted oxidoreductase